MDFASFAEGDFDAVQWVNAAVQTPRAEGLEAFVAPGPPRRPNRVGVGGRGQCVKGLGSHCSLVELIQKIVAENNSGFPGTSQN